MLESIPTKISPRALQTLNNMKAQMNIYLQGILEGMGIEGALGVNEAGEIMYPPTPTPLPEVKA